MNGNTIATTTIGRRGSANWTALFVALALAALALVFGADQASAKSEIRKFQNFPSTSQAGGHPDIFTEFELGSRITSPPVPCFCNDPKEVIQNLPAGVVANPHVVAECRVADLAKFSCPADSQAGIVLLQLFGSYAGFPIYRTTPFKGQAGVFAFLLPFGTTAAPQYLTFNARTGGDYGLTVKSVGISHLVPLQYYAPIFWGVPGDEFYDMLRFLPGESQGFQCIGGNPFKALIEHDREKLLQICPEGLVGRDVPSSLPVAPLNQNPTTCVGPLGSTMDVFSYDLEWTHAESGWPETTGCDGLTFDPSLAANPTTTDTDSASGLEVVLNVPQFQDPKVPSPSELKANSVTLPDGFSLNPSAVDGKVTCSDEQSSVGTEEEAHCPEFSKIGTVDLDSSALPAPIHGFLYLGEPKPDEPYRLVVTANGFGTNVKLLGTVHAGPVDGQLVTSFENLPQTPLQQLVLHIFGSERGLLATPETCGRYPVESRFTPWAAELSEQRVTQFFELNRGPGGEPCPGGIRDFSPTLTAGTTDNTAGTHSAFGLRVGREDGDQNLSGLTVKAPPGFLATLKGVAYCPEAAIDKLSSPTYPGRAEAASPACPATSRVGSASAASGAGTKPLITPGNVYLAGPYKGSPVSLLISVPAVGGPYDLGNVAVRAAVDVDPSTARVTAVSDPLPQILEGVPLRTRMIQINLDRPNFTLNPTSCDPFSIDVSMSGDEGSVSNKSAPFQVANCRDLPYSPKLKLKLSGGVNRLGHPAIKAVFRAKPGEANSKRISVALPPGEILDNGHIDTICRRPDFATDSCPAGSQVGTAIVNTPLLDEPLRGNAYLRASGANLPDLAVDLEGQIDIELSGRIGTSKDEALRTTFTTVPDAPVSSFVLNLVGGKKGLLQNSTGLCGAAKKAKVKMTGQNGAVVNKKVPLDVSCGKSKKSKRKRAR